MKDVEEEVEKEKGFEESDGKCVEAGESSRFREWTG